MNTIFSAGVNAWRLRTEDTTAELAVRGNALFVDRLECPAAGHNWTREPSRFAFMDRVVVNGVSRELCWEFCGAVLGENTLTMNFAASLPGLELSSVWTARENGPLEHAMRIINHAGEAVTVFRQESLDIRLIGDSKPVLWRFHKENARKDDVGIYKDKMADGADVAAFTNAENEEGTNGFIPLVYLDSASVHGLYVGWQWPHGRIRTSALGAEYSHIRIRAGFNDDFMTDIENGDALDIPPAYLGAYSGDVDDGSNRFKRWFFNYKVPPAMRENPREPLIQMDDQGLQDRADIASSGVDAVKWDYGWWPGINLEDPTNFWMRTCEGDWRLGNEHYQNKIMESGCASPGEYAAHLRSLGLSFTLYLILHDALCDGDGAAFTSVGPHALPKGFFTDQKITTGVSADLGDITCVGWMKEHISERLREFGARTWRSDFGPIATKSANLNRHKYGSDTSYWCAKGFYEILDFLFESIPGFRFENCGSGGSLKDYATLSKSNVIQYNDTSHYLDIRTTFYDSSYAIHPAQLYAPVNVDAFYACPEEEHYGWRSVILGTFNTGSPTGSYNLMPGTDTYFLLHYARMFRDKLRNLVRGADLYHILPRPDEVHWDGVQYFDPSVKEGIKGAVFLFKPTDVEGGAKSIKLRGLRPDMEYSLAFEDRSWQNTVASGARLLGGFEVHLPEPRGSEIIWIR